MGGLESVYINYRNEYESTAFVSLSQKKKYLMYSDSYEWIPKGYRSSKLCQIQNSLMCNFSKYLTEKYKKNRFIGFIKDYVGKSRYSILFYADASDICKSLLNCFKAGISILIPSFSISSNTATRGNSIS